jgi:hypothetical protein
VQHLCHHRPGLPWGQGQENQEINRLDAIISAQYGKNQEKQLRINSDNPLSSNRTILFGEKPFPKKHNFQTENKWFFQSIGVYCLTSGHNSPQHNSK